MFHVTLELITPKIVKANDTGENSSELITPDIVKAYDTGENSRSAVRYLGSAENNVPATLDAHKRVRNYLIVQIGVNNATRTGALTNMTVENVRNAQKVGATYVIQVILKC